MEKWEGKVAVVTGASAGIGASICERLVETGVQVAGLARRKDRVESQAKALSGKKGKLIPVECDVCNPESIEKAFRWVKENIGPIHILINNAGTFRAGPLMETQYSDWKLALDTNVLGLTKCTQEVFNQMQEAKIDGHIVLINSVAGHTPIVTEPPMSNMYSPSKFAVTCLAETYRKELLYYRTKIKISSISPGMVDTELFDCAGLGELRKSIGHKVAHLKPSDICDALIYILSTPPHVQVHDIIIRPVGDKS